MKPAPLLETASFSRRPPCFGLPIPARRWFGVLTVSVLLVGAALLRADDNYEENDVRSAATFLPANTWLSVLGGPGIQSDDDWYRIRVGSAERLVRIECAFSHAQGDIDLALYDCEGNLIGLSNSTTDNEAIASCHVNTTLFVRVYFANAGNPYDLRWTYDDCHEENNSLATASPLAENTLALGWQKDADWYRLTLPGGGPWPLFVQCSFYHTDGDIDMALYNSSGSLLATSSSSSDQERIREILPSGTYYLRVYGYLADHGNVYTLRWGRDDAHEPDNTLAEGRGLRPWETVQGIQADDDYYPIQVDPADPLHVRIECAFSHSEGDIDIALIRTADGTPLAVSLSVTDNELIDFILPAPGQYAIRVYFGNAGNLYSLVWRLVPDDRYEENDSLATAAGPVPEGYVGIEAMQGDEDWYALDIPPSPSGTTWIELWLHSRLLEGLVDLGLHDGSGTLVASTTTTYNGGGTRYVRAGISPAGRYYLRVYGANAQNGYQWFWQTDDPYEPNETLPSAWGPLPADTWLSTIRGLAKPLWLGDWYQISVVPGGSLQLAAECVFNHGGADLEFCDASGKVLAGSWSCSGNSEVVHVTVPAAGSYFLHVDNWSTAITEAYDLRWSYVGVPEITASLGVIPIADGQASAIDFGSVQKDGPGTSLTFTICNEGTATLLSSGLTVPAGYTVTEELAGNLPPGACDTFTVRLDTAVVGTKSGDISFANNDGDENPFDFPVTGRVTSPPPTATTLVAFNAVSIGAGEITLRWTTGVEWDVLGFRIERRRPDGSWTQVQTGLIAALGTGRPTDYALEDRAVATRVVSTYRLIAVDFRGRERVLAEAVTRPGIAVTVVPRDAALAVEVRATPGARLLLESTADAVHGPWVELAPITVDSSGMRVVPVGVNAEERAQFYRVRWE